VALPAIALTSFVLRLESLDQPREQLGLLVFIAFALIVKLGLFSVGGIYRRYWRNAGSTDLLLIWEISAVGTLVIFLTWIVLPLNGSDFNAAIPRSVALIDGALSVIYVTISRFSERTANYWRITHRSQAQHRVRAGKRVLIAGAGKTGIQVLESLAINAANLRLIGFLDDDTAKVGNFVREFKVLGRLSDLEVVVREQHIELVIIAMPSAPGSTIRSVAAACRQLKIEHRIVPGTAELATGKVSVNALRSIRIEDLLRRQPVELDVDHIRAQVAGKCILVTGAGGSIGSELVRQLARMDPAHFVLVGRGENSLFLIESFLRQFFPSTSFETHLVDIRSYQLLQQVFERTRPDIVFHAAANKHVPMLETNVLSAVTNNVLGTQNVIALANAFNVQRMVLLSTDKAVEPNSIMGMTKRTAELLILNASLQHPGRFAAVRFGNVLGSRGSVVPTLQQQIREGGPMTITSESMTRFFMSIPEAALLVLKAAALTDAGPLFVLNMGEPVRIMDLAEELVRLSGLVPGRDIEIKVTGPRPGEKLHEALFWDFESRDAIEAGAIFSLRISEDHLRAVCETIPASIRALEAAVSADRLDENQIRAELRKAAYTIPGTAVTDVTGGEARTVPATQTHNMPSNPVPSRVV
jgi:FlaA1/EpsC-like NDP-sugar epimerase